MNDNNKVSRKKFLMRLSLGVGGVAGALVSVPFISALVEPLLQKKKEQWRTIGLVTDFEKDKTHLVKFKNADAATFASEEGNSAAWLRKTGEQEFLAFSVNCTHLGCPVRWEDGAQLFFCPCHGGVYYKDGNVAAGPPPRPLTQFEVRIVNNELQLKTAPLAITV